MTDAELIAAMIERRVSELCDLADSANIRMEANRFETKAAEAEALASAVRRGGWRLR